MSSTCRTAAAGASGVTSLTCSRTATSMSAACSAATAAACWAACISAAPSSSASSRVCCGGYTVSTGRTERAGSTQACTTSAIVRAPNGPPRTLMVVRSSSPDVGYVSVPSTSISGFPSGASPRVFRTGPGEKMTYGTGSSAMTVARTRDPIPEINRTNERGDSGGASTAGVTSVDPVMGCKGRGA